MQTTAPFLLCKGCSAVVRGRPGVQLWAAPSARNDRCSRCNPAGMGARTQICRPWSRSAATAAPASRRRTSIRICVCAEPWRASVVASIPWASIPASARNATSRGPSKIDTFAISTAASGSPVVGGSPRSSQPITVSRRFTGRVCRHRTRRACPSCQCVRSADVGSGGHVTSRRLATRHLAPG